MVSNKKVVEKLQRYLEHENVSAKEILNRLSLFIYQRESSQTDLFHLAHLLSDESLWKLIDYYDGATIRIPTKENFGECLELAIVFFLREVKGLSWEEIKPMLKKDDKNFSSTGYGKKIESLKKDISSTLLSLLYNSREKIMSELGEISDGG